MDPSQKLSLKSITPLRNELTTLLGVDGILIYITDYISDLLDFRLSFSAIIFVNAQGPILSEVIF